MNRTVSDKTYQHYLTLLSKPRHIWLKNQINGLARALNILGYNSERSVHDGDRYRRLCNELYEASEGRLITQEQTQFGKAWLTSRALKKRGGVRAGSGFNPDHEPALRSIRGFRFMGFMIVRNGYGTPCSHTPIYRILTRVQGFTDGVDYSVVHFGGTYVNGNIEERTS